MAARCGSMSRSLISSSVRVSSLRSPQHVPRLRPSPSSAPPLHRRRLSFAPSRILGELGCTQSFLPFTAMPRLTAHLSAEMRACCELCHGTFRRTCPDR